MNPTVVEDCSEYPVIDRYASRSWHFPLNRPKRQYQFDIIKQAVMKNTLVALPTGLGKTFIASVVMYNFYRWYPTGKIVFIAPTRPLVTQQLEATLKTVEIDPQSTVEMNGAFSATQRQQMWIENRVFFLTPQVLQNDLISGICPGKKLVLLVFDEAHRALGNHAYCDIIRTLNTENDPYWFRVLALTATPASNVKTVQELLDSLLLSCICIRTEESPDVSPYVFDRSIDTVVVPENNDMKFVRIQFEQNILSPYVEKLYQMGAIGERTPSKLAPFTLIQARDHFRSKNASSNRNNSGITENLFAILISLYHAYDLLLLHGIIAFKTYLTKFPDDNAVFQSRIRHELNSNPTFVQLVSHIETQTSDPNFASHPKINLVEQTLLQHFSGVAGEKHETRAIVFSQFRESVYEIVAKISKHSPLLKVMSFVGQSSASNHQQKNTQKQQIKVLEEFRAGGYNVLVATCIGEEGLDIGNVDLIICFDMQSSPIRMLQRIGRTGRSRSGKIVLLLSEGREEQRYQRSLAQHKTVQRAISNPAAHFVLFRPSKDLLPSAPNPIEREFNLQANEKFLEIYKAQTLNSRSNGRKNDSGPAWSSACIPDALFTETLHPCFDRYPSWNKCLGASFLVSHSSSTLRYISLLGDFEALDTLPAGPSSVTVKTGLSPITGAAACNILMGDDVEMKMLAAINEMQIFVDHNHTPKTWIEYEKEFLKFWNPSMIGKNSSAKIKDLGMEDPKVRDIWMEGPRVNDLTIEYPKTEDAKISDEKIDDPARGYLDAEDSTVEDLKVSDLWMKGPKVNDLTIEYPKVNDLTIEYPKVNDLTIEYPKAEDPVGGYLDAKDSTVEHLKMDSFRVEDIPDDFFDDSSLENMSFGNQPAFCNQPNIYNQPDFCDRVISPLKSMTLRSRTQTPKKIIANDYGMEFASSQQVFKVPQKRNCNVVETSSVEPSPTESSGDKRRPSHQKRCAFVDFEAACSESDGSREDIESITSSLANFIDDGSEMTVDDEPGTTEGSGDDDAPSSEGMMAFYRRTAQQSQINPYFKTAPRQFAQKVKLKFQAASTDLDETDADQPIDRFADIDWSSDFNP